ncbi:hypothetical protein ABPG74_006726 [Tetrahymena malaccensis]
MNQLQNIQELNLNQPEFFLLSNAYRSCPKHPRNWIVSLATDPNSPQYLQCAQCISENPNQNTLHLLGLIEENEKTVFKNWPVFGQSQLYEKLKLIFEEDYSIEGLQTQISSFFLNLRKQIEHKINQKEEQMLTQAKKFQIFNQQVIYHYNKIAEKEQLKNIIVNHKDDFGKQYELFREIFIKISTNQQKYQEELNEKINFYETQKSMINFETAQQINQNIQQLLDSIDMFVIKNLEDLTISTQSDQREQFEANLHEMDKRDMSTSQLIVKLMSNKLNYCSKELLDKLQEIILTFSKAIDRMDVKTLVNDDLFKLDFEKMDESKFNIVKCITENLSQQNRFQDDETHEKKQKIIKLISNKFNYCSENFIKDISQIFDIIEPLLDTLDFSNYLQNEKSPISGYLLNDQQFEEVTSLVKAIQTRNNIQQQENINQNLINQEIEQNLEQLNQIFMNKTNYCSEQFTTNANISTKKYSNIIQTLFFYVKIFAENHEKTIDFSKITSKQIKDLEKLVNKMSQLNEQYGEAYYNLQSPIQPQQPNSSRIVKEYFLDRFAIQQLLVDYPILETIDPILIWPIEFIKSNYNNSQQLILEYKNTNGYIVKQPKSLSGQIITKNKLDANLNYIFRCKVNKNLNCNYIDFGIMQTQKVNTDQLYKEKCCFETSSKDYGLDKILKGKLLTEVVGDLNYIEIRVNISKQQVIFMDFPQYKNVNQVYEEKINKNQDYSFGIYFNGPGDDYNIEIEATVVDDKDFLNFD